MAKGSAFKREPSKYTRLSPGVYRNQQGQLTGPGGARLPAPAQSAPRPPIQPQQPMPRPQPPMTFKPMPFQPGQGQQSFDSIRDSLSRFQAPQQTAPYLQPPPQGYQQDQQGGPSMGDVQAGGGNTGIYGGPQQPQVMQDMYNKFLEWMKSQQGQQ